MKGAGGGVFQIKATDPWVRTGLTFQPGKCVPGGREKPRSPHCLNQTPTPKLADEG